MLAKLISFKTISSESNLDMIFFIKEYLEAFEIKPYLTFNAMRNKANLFAEIGPSETGGVILSGHTDVVPIEGQNWQTDPFKLVEKNDRLYGRGTCDMKSFNALVLAAVPKMLSSKLKKPIQLAFSYDEEVGCLGAPQMIKEIRDKLPKAAAVIVGEPTMMSTVNGHKTSIGLKTHLTGVEVHSSLLHSGVSAIMNGARLIEWINQQNRNNMLNATKKMHETFDPPYTTLHVGMIKGGTAGNITAKDCIFPIDIRCLPSESGENWVKRFKDYAGKVEKEMKGINNSANINIEIAHWVTGLKPENASFAEDLVRRITLKNGTEMVSYGTEAGQFQSAGYSTIICGPGSIKQAHQPNEYISNEQFVAGETFISRLIDLMR